MKGNKRSLQGGGGQNYQNIRWLSNKIFSSIHSLLLKTERRLLGHDRQTFSNCNGCIITLVGFLKKVWKNLKDNCSKCQKR